MRKRYFALAGAIVITGLLVMGAGAYLKYGILKPIGLGQDKDIVELPFLLNTDAGLRYTVEAALEASRYPTEPEESTDPTDAGENSDPTESEETSVPTDPKPTESEPTEPMNTEMNNPIGSEPTEPTPTEPQPTDPPPTEPQPTDPPPTEPQPTDPPPTQPQPTDPPPTQPQPTDPPPTQPQPTEPQPTQPKPTEPEPTEPKPTEPWFNPEDLDFSQGGVDISWFDDALIIGDSRTVGLRDYAPKGNMDYFCSVGMTVFDCRSQKVPVKDFGTVNLSQLLQRKQYGKVFINLGINEVGYPQSSFLKAYSELISFVQKAQPNTRIILMGIMTVGRGKAASASYFSIKNIYDFNQKIAAMGDGKTVFYIDVNTAFADAEGYLPSVMSGDGCHLYAKYYGLWSDWIAYIVAKKNL